MRRLGYDQYRALRPRPDSALWRDSKGLFRVEFFPAGFIYDKPVQIFVVDGGNATPVSLSTDQFDFSDTGLKALPQKLAPAGFRLRHPLNRPDKFDEIDLLPGRELLPADRTRAGLRRVGARACHRHRGGKARGVPELSHLLAGEARGRGGRHDGLGAARFARRDRRLLLHHPAGRAHPGRHQVRAVHAQRRLAARHRAADLDVLHRQGHAGARRLSAGDPRFRRPLRLDRQGRAHLAAVGQSRRSRRLGVPRQQPARLRPDAARARLRALPGHRCGPARTAEPVGRAGRRLGRRRGPAGRDPDPGGDQRQHRGLLGIALAGKEGRAQGVCLPALRPLGRGRTFAGRPRGGDARRRGAGPAQAAAHGGRVRRRRARLARAGTTRHVRRWPDERQAPAHLCRGPAMETRMAALHRLRTRRARSRSTCARSCSCAARP